MTRIEKRIQDEHGIPVPAIKALARVYSHRAKYTCKTLALDYEDLVAEGFQLGIKLKREMTGRRFQTLLSEVPETTPPQNNQAVKNTQTISGIDRFGRRVHAGRS